MTPSAAYCNPTRRSSHNSLPALATGVSSPSFSAPDHGESKDQQARDVADKVMEQQVMRIPAADG